MKQGTNRAVRNAKRGGALLVGILVSTVLLLLGAAFTSVTNRTNREVLRKVEDKLAMHLAEAALGEAVHSWEAGSSGAIASAELPARMGSGVFWTEVIELDGNRRLLRANAMAGSGRAALAAVVSPPGETPLFRYVLNSNEPLNINATVRVDSYVSMPDPGGAHDGSYESQAVNTTNGVAHANTNGSVASNQGVTINADAYVFGDATPGPGHGVTMGNGAYVSGSTASAPMTFDFPPVEVPSFPSNGNRVVADNGVYTLSSGDYAFEQLWIGKSARLIVRGPARIVVNDFTGDRAGRLEIDATAGPVTFYVKGSYNHLSGFEAVPATGSPMALAFMMTMDQNIQFASKTKIRGAYYAPHASILFTSQNEVWGAVAARRIEMSNQMRFHFDEVLADYWTTDGADEEDTTPLEGLARVRFEPEAFLRDRRDPFTLIGRRPDELPSPSQAWVP